MTMLAKAQRRFFAALWGRICPVFVVIPCLGCTPRNHEAVEPTISLNEVDNLANREIVEKLFTMYLEQFKNKSVINDKSLTDYKVVGVEEVASKPGKTDFHVAFSVKPGFWSSYWDASNGQSGDNGWKLRKGCFVRLIKEEKQFRMKILGTVPPPYD